MYFLPISVVIFSILWIPSTICYSSLRPKRSFHWSANTSNDREITQSTAYWIGGASTQLSNVCCLSTAAPSLRKHYVTVGAKGNLAFDPIEVDAGVGDVIIFTFLALNHTLTQSSLTEPCTNRGGFSTGFNQFNPKDKFGDFVVEYTVDNLDPQWFFCAQTSQTSHCQAGMVFALNAHGRTSAFISIATERSTSSATQSTIPMITAEDTMSKATLNPSPKTQPCTSSVLAIPNHSNTTAAPISQSSISSSASILPNSSVRVSQAPASSVLTAKQALTRALTQVWLLAIPFMAL